MKILSLRNTALALGVALTASANAVEIGDIVIEDLVFEPVGTAEYTDPFFKAVFEQMYGMSFKETFGIDNYTTTVTLEEATTVPGYYRLVHPYKQLCEEIIPQNEMWGAAFYYIEDSDYMRINMVDPQKAFVDTYLMESTGIFPMDGIYNYETPLYVTSGVWYLNTSGIEPAESWYLHEQDGVWMLPAVADESVDLGGMHISPLMTIAMWTDMETYGTVERYFPAPTTDFRLVLHKTTTGVESIESSAAVESVEYFDLSGRRLTAAPEAGIVLERTIFTDGTHKTAKRVF